MKGAEFHRNNFSGNHVVEGGECYLVLCVSDMLNINSRMGEISWAEFFQNCWGYQIRTCGKSRVANMKLALIIKLL